MINRIQSPSTPLLVVMGVSGSGKTTVGAALSQRLQVPFADADDFHPPPNIAKMAAGFPLDDADRLPWLRTVGMWLAAQANIGGVLSCSALKRSYRDTLRQSAPTARFLHLNPPPEVVRRRMASRMGHFMPASLINSQFEALQPLQPDENGITLALDLSVDQVVAACTASTLIFTEETP